MRIKIFLAGDVMVGRGIDQILPFPGNPRIHEQAIKDARAYVALAEKVSGKIDRPVSFDYIWGDAIPEIERIRPDVRIVNLETAVTGSEDYLPKGINYRLNPQNISVLKVLGIQACALANNHILDWGREGLMETLRVLAKNGLMATGAGGNLQEAKSPSILALNRGRVILFDHGHPSSGIPPGWEAGEQEPGVNLLRRLAEREIPGIKGQIDAVKGEEDFVIFSIHWGPNWGYEIDETFRHFARRLIDFAGVDLVFGHSSHHFKGLEIYKHRLILYGAGDLINDYEGIQGYEEFRDDLSLMYFPEVDLKTKHLVSLVLVPMQIKKFRLNYPTQEDFDRVLRILQRESRIGERSITTRDRAILIGPQGARN